MNKLTIKQAQEKMAQGELSSLELTKACLKRIDKSDKKIQACLSLRSDEALHEAKEADRRRKKGGQGELLGIPYLAKDNIMTKGVKTTAASKILANYVAPYDATIIKKLKHSGAILLGKTNLDEFAHGASTENSAFGPTHNPWDLERVPGGSSGGSAAAVAADMCLFALGTDTGGSIRHPAGFCGVSGLKPSYGRASRFGLIAMTSSTDVPGPICKDALDTAIVLRHIAGLDKNDATTLDESIPDYLEKIAESIKDKRIGLPIDFINQASEEIKNKFLEAIKIFEGLGAEIKEISLPHAKYGVSVYYIITPSEISSNLARFDGVRYGLSVQTTDDLIGAYKKSRGEGFGAEAKRRIMLGTYVLSAGYFDAYYLKAQKVRTIIKKEMDAVLADVDAIMTPTTAGTAFKIGEQSDDPLKMYLEDIFAAGPSLAGLPAISIPGGFINELPIGLQIIGSSFGEASIFNLAYLFQKNTDHHLQKPNIV